MRVIVRQLGQVNGVPGIAEGTIEGLQVCEPCLLSIDGSTSNTGMAVIRMRDGALLFTVSAKYDSEDASAVHYKIKLKKLISMFLLNNKQLNRVYYEEPIISHVTAVANLMMLRTSVQELLIENDLNYVDYAEIPNMSWKKWFLAPEKIPNGSDAQKSAVTKKLVKYMPFLSCLTQDEVDATAMGVYAVHTLKDNNMDSSVLKANKKQKPFSFKYKFLGADSDECLGDLMQLYDGPSELIDKGIPMCNMGRRQKFEQAVYDTIGSEDRLCIIKFESKNHGNVILQYRLGNLAAQFEYIYALCWRSYRKK